MRRAMLWTFGMALSPFAFGVVVFLALTVLNEVANRASVTGIVAAWFFVLFFGAVLYVPAALLAAAGGIVLARHVRTGRVLATVGLAGFSVIAVLVVSAIVDDALTERPHMDTSWLAQLTIPEVLVFAVPFALHICGGIHTLRAVWTVRPGPLDAHLTRQVDKG